MRHRQKLLLALLSTFEEAGREEVSLSEVLEGIHELEEKLRIGYSFVPRVFYSPKLFGDLEKLVSRGYVDQYRYAHNGFVPKHFVKLTYLGRGEGRAQRDQLNDSERAEVRRAAHVASERFHERWKIFARVAARV